MNINDKSKHTKKVEVKKTVWEPNYSIPALKPQVIVDRVTNSIAAWSIFAVTLLVYLITNAKTMSFWDSGEYATCISIFGIPHPPGNPFYIVFGRAFTALFGGAIPHSIIASAISSIFSAFAVMLTYLFTVKIVSMFEKNKVYVVLAGALAAIYTAFSFTFWMNAIEAEVYAGLVVILNLIIYLTMVWVEKSDDFSHQNLLLLIVYTFFLGFCIHQTSLQIAPAVLFIVVFPMLRNAVKTSDFWVRAAIYTFVVVIGYYIFNGIGEKLLFPMLGKWVFMALCFGFLYWHLRDKISNRVWLLGLAMLIIGITPHIYLLIRSEFRPFINEGYPHTWDLFMDYILRRQYGNTTFFERRASLGYQFNFHFLQYFGWQWFNAERLHEWTNLSVGAIKVIGNSFVALLGFAGMWHQLKENKFSFYYFFSLFFMTSFAMVFVMNLSDQEVRERDYFFVAAYNLWTLWMGVGTIYLIKLCRPNKLAMWIVALLLCTMPIISMASQYHEHDRTGEYISLDYGQNFLNSLEKDAIIFTNGDNDTFPLWYAQAVKDAHAKEFIHPKTDVVNSSDSQNAIAQAMAFKKTELKGIRQDVSIANLSLLNTPWYIRQLRDKEGILFNIPDSDLDRLTPIRLSEDTTIPITGPNGESFNITIPKDKMLLVRDLAVIQIIRDNFGKRPIYFAVTCAETVGFENNLRNEGMVDRVVATYGDNQVNIDRLTQNLNQVYSYRGIFDRKVYKDSNMLRLINNYGAAYMRVSRYYHERGNFKAAAANIEKAMGFISDQSKFYLSMAQIFADAGDKTKMLDFVQRGLAANPNDAEAYQQAAYLFFEQKMNQQAVTYLEKAVSLAPQSQQLAGFIYKAADTYGAYSDGARLLDRMAPAIGVELLKPYIDSLRAKS